MRNIKFACRMIACLMVLVLILHWQAAVLLLQMTFQQPEILHAYSGQFLFSITSFFLFIILNLLAAIGLFKLETWGFKYAYPAIIAASLTGICYLPLTYKGFYRFFLSQPSLVPMIIINLTFLIYVIYLNRQFLKVYTDNQEFHQKL